MMHWGVALTVVMAALAIWGVKARLDLWARQGREEEAEEQRRIEEWRRFWGKIEEGE